MSEWKGGDVARVIYGNVDQIGLVRTRKQDADQRLEFAYVSGGFDMVDDLDPDEARPLVTIDPEDAEQVERLNSAWIQAKSADLDDTPLSLGALRMRQALREFAPPTPRIEEPQGRYAVVVDEDENEWVHDGLGHHSGDKGEWWCATAARKNSSAARRADWADIDAVQILSPGVTP